MKNNGTLLEVLEDWQKPVSDSQIEVLRTSKNTINSVTFGDLLDGINPNYQAVGGKVSQNQIEKLKQIIQRGTYSHVNYETMSRFLKKEKPFDRDYFSLKYFSKKNVEKFCVWENVFYCLKDIGNFPIRRTSSRAVGFKPELKFDLKKNQTIHSWINMEDVPEIYQIIQFLEFDNRGLHKDGQWNFFPLFDPDKEVVFLKVWIYNNLTNMEILDTNLLYYLFNKSTRFFSLN